MKGAPKYPWICPTSLKHHTFSTLSKGKNVVCNKGFCRYIDNLILRMYKNVLKILVDILTQKIDEMNLIKSHEDIEKNSKT